ncbi:MAG: endonuclease domain-containing protein [Pseudomonadota bacterium]
MPAPPAPETIRARRLRQATNTPERIAWETLRTLRGQGFPLRKQHPIAGYVADFAIVKAKLVIEIDGAIHDRPAVQADDHERQRILEAHGWRVLRVSAEEARSADHLLSRVAAALGI